MLGLAASLEAANRGQRTLPDAAEVHRGARNVRNSRRAVHHLLRAHHRATNHFLGAATRLAVHSHGTSASARTRIVIGLRRATGRQGNGSRSRLAAGLRNGTSASARAGIVVSDLAAVFTASTATLLHAANMLDAIAKLIGLLHITVDVAVNNWHFRFAARLARLAISTNRSALANNLAALFELTAGNRTHPGLGL